MPYGIQQMQQQMAEQLFIECCAFIYPIKLGDYDLLTNFVLSV